MTERWHHWHQLGVTGYFWNQYTLILQTFVSNQISRFSPRDCITFHPIWHLHFASFNNTKFLWPFGLDLGDRREGKGANREIFFRMGETTYQLSDIARFCPTSPTRVSEYLCDHHEKDSFNAKTLMILHGLMLLFTKTSSKHQFEKRTFAETNKYLHSSNRT